MPVKKNVVAAVTAAVSAYLDDEQAVLLQGRQKAVRPQGAFQPYSPWVMAGRAVAMEVRRNWQLRLVR